MRWQPDYTVMLLPTQPNWYATTRVGMQKTLQSSNDGCSMYGILHASISCDTETGHGKTQADGDIARATIGRIGDCATYWPS